MQHVTSVHDPRMTEGLKCWTEFRLGFFNQHENTF